LGENGHVSYSGGLTPGIPVATLEPTRQTLAGSVWFFHHDWHTAHNGVDTAANFRVWRATETEQN